MAPRRTVANAAGGSASADRTPVGPTPEGTFLAMAWGGKRYADAARLAASSALDGLTARMQAHHDPMARRDFVLGLLCREGHEALPMLDRFVGDPDVLVRWAVTQEGRAWACPQSAALWERLSVDPSPVVRQALSRTLAATPGASSIALLCRMADDPDVWVRLSLVALFGQLCEHHAVKQALTLCLGDRDPWVRANALQTLAQAAPDKDGLDALAKLARTDPVPWVRRTALRELALLQPWRARLTLARMPGVEQSLVCMLLRLAPEPPLRLIADTMRVFESELPHGHRRLDQLADVVRDPRTGGTARYDARKEMFAQARDALARVSGGTERQDRDLQNMFDSGSDAIRTFMCDAGLVDAKGNNRSRSPMSDTVSEAQASSVLLDPLHPLLALDSLPARNQNLNALFPVIDMAQRSLDVMARSHAAWLLADLCQHPNAWPLLATLLDDSVTQVRQQVAQAVLSVVDRDGLPEQQVLPLLKRLLSDAHPDVRKVAVAALARCDFPDKRELLQLAARDSDAVVRLATVRPWSQLEPHGATFLRLATDSDPHVRSAVADALSDLPFNAMHLASSLLSQPLTMPAWRRLTQALAQRVKGPKVYPFSRDVSLLVIDGMRSAAPDLAEAEYGLRTWLLVDALRSSDDWRRPPAMLLDWAAQMHLASRPVRQAACARLTELNSYTGRNAIFAVLLASPADDVREAARCAMGQILNEGPLPNN